MTPPSPLIVAVRTSFVIITALTLQLGVLSSFAPFGVQADLLLLVAIGGGIAAGPDRGAAIGFAAGIAYDLMLQTPFGLSALTYAIVAYLVGSLQDSVLRAAWWIPVGKVRTVRETAGGLTLELVVRPMADTERMQFVTVLLWEPPT